MVYIYKNRWWRDSTHILRFNSGICDTNSLMSALVNVDASKWNNKIFGVATGGQTANANSGTEVSMHPTTQGFTGDNDDQTRFNYWLMLFANLATKNQGRSYTETIDGVECTVEERMLYRVGGHDPWALSVFLSTPLETVKKQINIMLQAATECGVYVVITFGGFSDSTAYTQAYDMYDATSDRYKAHSALVAAIADEFKGHPALVGLEPLNEPDYMHCVYGYWKTHFPNGFTERLQGYSNWQSAKMAHIRSLQSNPGVALSMACATDSNIYGNANGDAAWNWPAEAADSNMLLLTQAGNDFCNSHLYLNNDDDVSRQVYRDQKVPAMAKLCEEKGMPMLIGETGGLYVGGIWTSWIDGVLWAQWRLSAIWMIRWWDPKVFTKPASFPTYEAWESTDSGDDPPPVDPPLTPYGWATVNYPNFTEPQYVMPTTQRLAFKIVSEGKDYGVYLESGDVDYGEGQVNTLDLTLNNRLGLMRTAGFTNGTPVAISGSVDGGATFYPMFHGVVYARNNTVAADGHESLKVSAYGGAPLRQLYPSPNQVAMGPCDIIHVFRGLPWDRNGEVWNPDNQGNYPEGFLYKTGYYYTTDSVYDVFPGTTQVIGTGSASYTASVDTWDLPTTIACNGSTIFDNINKICDAVGLMVFVDDANRRVMVRSDSALADFPECTVTLSEGEEISTLDYGLDDAETADRVVVIGNNDSLFYSIGRGPREKLITDASLTTIGAVRQKAESMYRLYHDGVSTARVSVPGLTCNPLGYRISLVSPRHSLSSLGNVIGMSHRFTPSSWVTDLDLESRRRTVPKVLKEVQDKVKELNKDSEAPIVYLHVRSKPRYNQAENIAAIGVGTSSGTRSNGAAPSELISLRESPSILDRTSASASLDGTSITNLLYDKGALKGRVREVCMFPNDNAGGACDEVTYGVNLNMGGTVGGWNKVLDLNIPYVVGIKEISGNTVNNDQYRWSKPTDGRVFTLYHAGDFSGAGAIPAPDDDIWAGQSDFYSPGQLTTLSSDFKGVLTASHDANGTVSNHQFYTIFEMPIDLPGNEPKVLKTAQWNLRHGCAAGQTNNVYVWKISADRQTKGWSYLTYSDGGNSTVLVRPQIGNSSSGWVVDTGSGVPLVRICVVTTAAATAALRYSPQYCDLSYILDNLKVRRSASFNTIEKAIWRANEGRLVFQHKPTKINHIWLWGSYSDESNIVIPDTVGDEIPYMVAQPNIDLLPVVQHINNTDVYIDSHAELGWYDHFMFKPTEKQKNQARDSHTPMILMYQYPNGEIYPAADKPWGGENVVKHTYMSIWDMLEELKCAWVEYEYELPDSSSAMPTPKAVPTTNAKLVYKDGSYQSSSVHLWMDEKSPGYGVTGANSLRIVARTPGQSMGHRWVAGDGRIDQGIVFDGRQTLALTVTRDYGETNTLIDGVGCSAPATLSGSAST